MWKCEFAGIKSEVGEMITKDVTVALNDRNSRKNPTEKWMGF
jgi:hypothetical protein